PTGPPNSRRLASAHAAKTYRRTVLDRSATTVAPSNWDSRPNRRRKRRLQRSARRFVLRTWSGCGRVWERTGCRVGRRGLTSGGGGVDFPPARQAERRGSGGSIGRAGGGSLKIDAVKLTGQLAEQVIRIGSVPPDTEHRGQLADEWAS